MRLVGELGPNALGQHLDPGRVGDCSLALPLPADDAEGPGGVLVVVPRALLDPAVPQPAGSLLYELVTGHPDREPGELVLLADLAVELRAWARDRWAGRGVDVARLAAAEDVRMEDKGSRRRRQVCEAFKRDAVELVRVTGRPLAQVAHELEIHDPRLGNWVRLDRIDRGGAEGLASDERARLRQLEPRTPGCDGA